MVMEPLVEDPVWQKLFRSQEERSIEGQRERGPELGGQTASDCINYPCVVSFSHYHFHMRTNSPQAAGVAN